MFPESAADSLGNSSRVERRQTFNAETWTQEGLRYVVFGDAAPEDIQRLSVILKSAAKS
jgi:hypothetical protein